MEGRGESVYDKTDGKQFSPLYHLRTKFYGTEKVLTYSEDRLFHIFQCIDFSLLVPKQTSKVTLSLGQAI
jgi:hypothetical protein